MLAKTIPRKTTRAQGGGRSGVLRFTSSIDYALSDTTRDKATLEQMREDARAFEGFEQSIRYAASRMGRTSPNKANVWRVFGCTE
jgi:hypothetical protein